ncbi:hypothetical protein K1T35_47875 (plasmid) [Pseudonocardia sp. DSM 110487]|uniref:DUF6545 domain-containing protein n=1 Tax=Pseudonocardia sp. DSM 110487 TaxID=2865833 RepID=UPI001C698881|nr:DUF6545 domain-containing protein [Pseudonocardia sp. DSM 110487]QYN41070.1 hypothetical protein K1T35_47875 [Pseudonocardia sp. DSM 110487]
MVAPGPELIPVTALALAGALRLRERSRSRRDVAVALLCAAAATALTVEQIGGVSAAHLVDLRDLLWLLLITAAATATFALARQISLSSMLLPWPPLALGMAAGLLQIVLFYAATTARADARGSVLDHTQLAESVALWLVTLAGPALAGSLLVLVMIRYRPGVGSPLVRAGLAVTMGGLAVLGLAAVAVAAQLLVDGTAPTTASDRELPSRVVELLCSAGLVLVAAGFLIPRVSRWVDPVRAVVAARRLGPLADVLAAVVSPGWARRQGHLDMTMRSRPAVRLYQQVILIRDASWALLSAVDDDLIAAAVEHARRCAPDDDEFTIAATAEACWLSWAVRIRRAGLSGNGPVDHEQGVIFLDRQPDEPLGSLREEVAFLSAVTRAWRGSVVREFLAGLETRRPVADR